MMKYSDFTKEVTERLQQALGTEYHVSIQQMSGNNGIKRDAAVISVSGSSMAECIAVSAYYELCREKADIDIIVDELVRDYMKLKTREQIPNINMICNWNSSKERVVFRLVNSDANRELLQKIPHFEFLNLSQIFYLMVDLNAEYCQNIMVTNMLMETWGISADELLSQAQKNTPLSMPEKLMDIYSFLSEEAAGMINISDGSDLRMYVLTNKMNLYGAGCILYEGLLKRTAEKFGSGFYVLPSSVHELILIPTGGCSRVTAWSFKQMVMSINHNQVPEQDILSDSVYYYNKEEKQLDIVF